MIEIKSMDDPRIADYSNLKNGEKHGDLFISDHEKTVIRHLQSTLPIKSVLLTEKYYYKHRDLILLRVQPEDIYVCSVAILEGTIGFPVHQGCMSIGVRPTLSNSSVLKGNMIYCDGLVDSENMGSILRTAACFGISSIMLSGNSISPYLRRCIRVSMGNVFYQNFYRTSTVDELFKYNKFGYNIIALSLPREGKISIPIGNFQFPEKFILVLGNENSGISDNILQKVNKLVTIPMFNGVDSLNVSHSLAIILAFWKNYNYGLKSTGIQS